MQKIELQDRLSELRRSTSVLWSTLEAIHDAMGSNDSTPETYEDAILGVSNLAYTLKEELGQVVEALYQDEEQEGGTYGKTILSDAR